MPFKADYAPPLSARAYAHCFLTFRKYSTEWLSMLQWCRECIGGLLPSGPRLSALSVGAGNGDFDWRLLPILKSQATRLEYVFVEPSQAMCDYLHRRIDSEPLDGVAFDLETSRFETCKLGQAFDLVLLTHCLYYIPDREAALRNAARLAGDKGRVLVFHQTPLGIDQVQKRYIQKVKGTEEEMYTSQEIQQLLDQVNIPYRLEQIDSHIDVSECLRPDSREGEALLSFFLECDIRHIDQGLKQEIVDYIQDLSFSDSGKRVLNHPVAVFVL
ncbi:MAG: class I SAM-dependent methyltransferase [Deltaproteobacteria bacterium]|nr:class I SAM-dependent methyltransferase [Deltaproteobacteria bacterium]